MIHFVCMICIWKYIWERLGFLILLMCFALKGIRVSSKSYMCESVIVPSWCRPACGSLVKAPRAHTGTAGSSGLLRAGNQTPPCRSHTPAPSTWSYLEVVGGMERYFKTWDKEAPERVLTCFEQPPRTVSPCHLECYISKAGNKHRAFTWTDLRNSVIWRLQTDLHGSLKNMI